MQWKEIDRKEADDEEVVRAYDYKVYRTYFVVRLFKFYSGWSFVSFHVSLCVQVSTKLVIYQYEFEIWKFKSQVSKCFPCRHSKCLFSCQWLYCRLLHTLVTCCGRTMLVYCLLRLILILSKSHVKTITLYANGGRCILHRLVGSKK